MGGWASSKGSMKQPSPINKPAFNANSQLGQNVRLGGERKVVNPTESYTNGRLENFLDLFV